jgi:hypothetical protein
MRDYFDTMSARIDAEKDTETLYTLSKALGDLDNALKGLRGVTPTGIGPEAYTALTDELESWACEAMLLSCYALDLASNNE